MDSNLIQNISKNEIIKFLTDNLYDFDFEEAFMNDFEIEDYTEKDIEEYKKRTIDGLAGKLKDRTTNTVTAVERNIIQHFYDSNVDEIDDNSNSKMIQLFDYFSNHILQGGAKKSRKGGKKSRKVRKSRKGGKSRKSRKVRKSRKSRKSIKSRK